MQGSPDFGAAAEFLRILDPNTDKFCFRTFDDNKDRANPNLQGKFNGTLREHFGVLRVKSSLGGGVFVVVNEGGQSAEEIMRVRYIFVDTDGAPLEPILEALPPHMVILSSPGKYHVYWRAVDVPLKEFGALQKAAIAKFGTDKQVHDLSRVMRLPGFDHQKGAPTRVKLLNSAPELPSYSFSELQQAIGFSPKAKSTSQSTPTFPPGTASLNALLAGNASRTSGGHTLQEVETMLRHLEPFEDRTRWMRVAFALADEFGEEGRNLYRRWSRGDLWEGTK